MDPIRQDACRAHRSGTVLSVVAALGLALPIGNHYCRWNANQDTNTLGYSVWHRMHPSTNLWTQRNVGNRTSATVMVFVGTNLFCLTAYDQTGHSLPSDIVEVVGTNVTPMPVTRLWLQWSGNFLSWTNLASLAVTNQAPSNGYFRGFLELQP